jgi:hypothetical protein
MSPVWTVESNDQESSFGYSVGTAGDVNGDGYSDAIVGTCGIGTQAAYVYHGSAGGLGSNASWTAYGDGGIMPYFGWSVGTAGDVNGDGFSDVIVGASGYDNGQEREGCAYVYHGSPGGLSLSAVWKVEGNQAFAWLGYSVGTAGDVNGDGFSDVIVGVPYDYLDPDSGRAFVFHGSSVGLGTSPSWTMLESGSGHSVGTAGDVNGDG